MTAKPSYVIVKLRLAEGASVRRSRDIWRSALQRRIPPKLVKHGGLLTTRWKVPSEPPRIFRVFAGLRDLAWGCEHFGPQILTGDQVTDPLRLEDFHVQLPTGPGLGVRLDHNQMRRYARM